MFKPSEEIIIRSAFTLSSNPKHKRVKKWIACNGEALASRQELQIYEFLLEQEGIHVYYEKAFEGTDHTSYPDFTVENLTTGRVFLWEHVGMTNNEHYLNEIPRKLLWFKSQGIDSIENGGDLIISFYREGSFYRDVVNFVEQIISKSK
ncbi:MAG: hypothetical protein H6599_09605 [Flavobacteriales bacterium]|nr:hypothetical protein [Flavobacteriales bacterium]